MKYKRVITTSTKWPGMPCATVSGELKPVDPDERLDLSLEQAENSCPDCESIRSIFPRQKRHLDTVRELREFILSGGKLDGLRRSGLLRTFPEHD